jgi:hypothetical protein
LQIVGDVERDRAEACIDQDRAAPLDPPSRNLGLGAEKRRRTHTQIPSFKCGRPERTLKVLPGWQPFCKEGRSHLVPRLERMPEQG